MNRKIERERKKEKSTKLAIIEVCELFLEATVEVCEVVIAK